MHRWPALEREDHGRARSRRGKSLTDGAQDRQAQDRRARAPVWEIDRVTSWAEAPYVEQGETVSQAGPGRTVSPRSGIGAQLGSQPPRTVPPESAGKDLERVKGPRPRPSLKGRL